METTQEKVVGSAEEEKARKKSVKKAKRRKRAKRFFIGFVAIVLAVIILTAVTNTIIYKSLLNKVHSFSAADSAGIDFEYYDNGKANIYTDNGLKLLQITDVHIGAGWMCPNKDTMALNAVAAMVTAEKPDLVMVTGDDPAGAVYNLRDYIVHTHAKDGKQLFYKDPEIVYGVKSDPIVTGPSFEEVPLGEGSVPWEKYLAALEDIGFRGFLTIEREVGDNPEKDIRSAVEFLKKLG